MQGDAFRGHDESSTSLNKGTFREFIDWYKDKVEVVKDAYDNGSKNCQMLSHHIQKNLTKACAEEVMAVVMDEIRGRKFSVLIDESRDVSIKEQMAMILRFVNDEGKVLERFVEIQHIERCTAVALKEALVGMLCSHKLSISMLRGQGYDGASNMRGEFNGVQKLIRDENPYAFYVHCFAHQLQLVVVTVSTSTPAIADFFNYVPLIVNTVGASCMRKDALLARQHDLLLEKVENGEILTGRGLNQESSLARPGDTRWGSHLKTLLRILVMWEAIIDVLEIVKKDSIKPTCNGGAFGLIGKMESFDFVFIMHLMIELLSITDILSRALQRKDQDIVEAMHLIIGVKDSLQDMRDNGWEPLFKRVKIFCDKNEIEVPDMDKEVNARGTSARRRQKVTNMHFYQVEIFLAAIDSIISEMNHRFGEVSFDIGEIAVLPSQLRGFVGRVRRSQEFFGCTELPQVAEIVVKVGMDRSYPLVYRLIEMTLILPVATASVERVFSAMSIIKTDLRNKMGDEWLNDLMICYVEKEIFRSISNEKIIKRFEEMAKRRMLVPK
ncbi:zinc finger MYM-type-like protein [Rhynchospora pubera]|uniref:Zinc finger MYM-type-like protein n=1 Tax=Rhynchospora pubera TaxID=906938 RepID=A0AAV8F0E9_9POAL|nr:zinc finger MYM-type-like protein [Rhynchospora pubera]